MPTIAARSEINLKGYRQTSSQRAPIELCPTCGGRANYQKMRMSKDAMKTWFIREIWKCKKDPSHYLARDGEPE